MTDGSDRRQKSAAILRALADLVEQHPEVKEPRVRVDWYFQDAAPAPAMKLARGVFPDGAWSVHQRQSSDGKSQWLDLEAGTAEGVVSPGVWLCASADASAVCEESGTRTVTVWKPSPAIADMVSGEEPAQAVAT